MLEKIVLVTRRTRLEDLTVRFNTRAQARFFITHAGGDFADYEREDDAYQRSLEAVRRALDLGLPLHVVDRALVPTMLFSARDLVVTLGQDGLVANTAKYVGAQPIVAVNPDPARFDGVLLPFLPDAARAATERTLAGKHRVREVTLAEARLSDGQRLLAFNDLYVGSRTHVSSRYRITCGERTERHSSSGIVISTGAGSTGWMSSIFNMAAGVAALLGVSEHGTPPKLGWEDRRLLFVVREPYRSRHSEAGLVAGLLEAGQRLRIESAMPADGVVFSDGVEADALRFESGAAAEIGAAEQRAQLVVA